MEDIILNSHEKHEIVYELRALVDGEVVAKATSHIAADDVAADAWQIDDAVEKLALENEQERAELVVQTQIETKLDEERGVHG